MIWPEITSRRGIARGAGARGFPPHVSRLSGSGGSSVYGDAKRLETF
ncbi:hypothetical protein BURMUCF2_3388 [Burkholderia multivorans CF2]|nr:hypothetical protein BURMUCF2_3388 [Burkholderia multivorans CF2]